jgi:hypothetical protein
VQALDDVAADALLPCKPEAAERLVPLATPPVTLHVRACDVKGQTFAISWALLPVGADPVLALQRWQQAAAAAVKAGPIAGAPTPWRVAGSDEGIRLLSQGQRHNGDTIATEWRYARAGGDTTGDLRWCGPARAHDTVLGEPRMAKAPLIGAR